MTRTLLRVVVIIHLGIIDMRIESSITRSGQLLHLSPLGKPTHSSTSGVLPPTLFRSSDKSLHESALRQVMSYIQRDPRYFEAWDTLNSALDTKFSPPSRLPRAAEVEKQHGMGPRGRRTIRLAMPPIEFATGTSLGMRWQFLARPSFTMSSFVTSGHPSAVWWNIAALPEITPDTAEISTDAMAWLIRKLEQAAAQALPKLVEAYVAAVDIIKEDPVFFAEEATAFTQQQDTIPVIASYTDNSDDNIEALFGALFVDGHSYEVISQQDEQISAARRGLNEFETFVAQTIDEKDFVVRRRNIDTSMVIPEALGVSYRRASHSVGFARRPGMTPRSLELLRAASAEPWHAAFAFSAARPLSLFVVLSETARREYVPDDAAEHERASALDGAVSDS
jgi:hypothetical protein